MNGINDLNDLAETFGTLAYHHPYASILLIGPFVSIALVEIVFWSCRGMKWVATNRRRFPRFTSMPTMIIFVLMVISCASVVIFALMLGATCAQKENGGESLMVSLALFFAVGFAWHRFIRPKLPEERKQQI